MSANKTWFSGLQALRAMLFLTVFISHSGRYFSTEGTWGAFAVEVFFVLSGFLSAHAENNAQNSLGGGLKSGIERVKHRLLKYYPLYFVMLLFMVPTADLSVKSLIVFILNLFLLQSYVGKAGAALSFNWPAWFLSSIMLSYFVSGILNRMRNAVKKHSIITIICIFAFQTLWAFLWRNNHEAYKTGYYMVYICPLIRMLDFFQGMLLFSVYELNFTGAGKEGSSQRHNKLIWTIFEGAVLVLTILMLNLFDIFPPNFPSGYCHFQKNVLKSVMRKERRLCRKTSSTKTHGNSTRAG